MVGRPKKYAGIYRSLYIRIPIEKMIIFEKISEMAKSADIPMNDLMLELLELTLPSIDKTLKRLGDASENLNRDLKKQARTLLFKTQLRERVKLYEVYRRELDGLLNTLCPNNVKSNGEVMRSYRNLCELRDEILKLISSAPVVDEEVEQAYNIVINDDILRRVEELNGR